MSFRPQNLLGLLLFVTGSQAQPILSSGLPAQLLVRKAGEHGVRITLWPGGTGDKSTSPYLNEALFTEPALKLQSIKKISKAKVGNLRVEVRPEPLTVMVSRADGSKVQEITFLTDGKVKFLIDNKPVLGLGEGGAKPASGVNWRQLPVEFDRRGLIHEMQPRWQADAYGSRNPVAFLVGTSGWGIFVAAPWGQIDLTQRDGGTLIPWEPTAEESVPQTQKNQGLALSKGKPPADRMQKGYKDIFVFDAREPRDLLFDISRICGRAVVPPKWSLGYMQSHRTLEDEKQLVGIVDTFREKKIPVDAVIYLGTGFCPRGWNTRQPSFSFNPEVFQSDPKTVLNSLHDRNVKVLVHIVPWDRDQLPKLHGSIPAVAGEPMDESHIQNYWQQHVSLMTAGVDAFWPDEGDWFNLHERIKRHQMYYQGPISTLPDIRPWSLHRNGHLGIAQWGGWVWSGDTESTWKTLEAQIAVGISHSLSLSPFWGSDIGGFYPTNELTGELYIRWFQFAAFCPSFRSHGRTWWTRLPWGWGLSQMGPLENRVNPPDSALNDARIEPIARKYAELRYQLLSYNYTLTAEARDNGLPPMRALWIHYPKDDVAASIGDQFLWGKSIMVAPVYTRNAATREIYLPAGLWYDWWTNEKLTGGRKVSRRVDLSVLPLYLSAGSIVPIDPVRQFTAENVDEPLTIRVYPGANGSYDLYHDDGASLQYLQGKAAWTRFSWDDAKRQLTIESPPRDDANGTEFAIRDFSVVIISYGTSRVLKYSGKKLTSVF